MLTFSSDCSLSLWLCTNHLHKMIEIEYHFITPTEWEKDGNYLPRVNGRQCQRCLGDIVLYCTWSRDAGRVCLNTPFDLYPLSTFSLLVLFFVLLCNLAEMEVRYFWQLWTSWRQHRGDSALLCVFVCRIYQHIRRMPFSTSFHRQTDRQTDRQRGEIGTKGRARKHWICAIVFFLLYAICNDFTIWKPLPHREWKLPFPLWW